MLSALGGALGIIVGVEAPNLIKFVTNVFAKIGISIQPALIDFANSPTLTPPMWIAVAFVSSAVIGIISGFYPAWKASKLDPIEALHYE